ncbi:probable ribonuclease ZC3H12C isoform X2 [Plodia interpunctella]|uniref:probable ribonuclease ZC3H12C isoform X2 n=1 Tax=Plodia interpunctella TaxID=58824 RepID=UPI002368DEF2|nr:probable ribonuclease ZC3H12C isoform X2 [Plodia interpunctella]XP_053620036.1 probable ribonuclease ZC3H12C isoform X2 [Plodia interpunctella]XP_053620037.1 probable ribonuclease ZC3H12C isoform X2 [Plodia interpunctella]XP_053620038.1 probable ribonuclease ZC3H12C isoform X2 [Plodia interpunctella]XP_053620039.1 probable ribonuclease ZC3H12C isoform X2 [Plodia interpunctella]
MAKKKKNKSSRNSSSHSFPMNPKKIHNDHKAKKRKTNKNIKKLLDQLHSESNSSLVSVQSLNNTLDTTKDNTVIVIDQSANNGVKRKVDECVVSESKRSRNNSTIVINDEDDIIILKSDQNTNSPSKCMNPIDCSTPIAKASSSRLAANETKEINGDSYLTIDLTTDSELRGNTSKQNTVIDLVSKHDTQDCSIVSVSNTSISSGDSDVTVINMKKKKSTSKNMKKIASGIAKLNSSEKGRLLELITKNIFNGCQLPATMESSHSIVNRVTRGTETQEDTYIREVILGEAPSRNSIGSNIYNPARDIKSKSGLRMIIIDGSNVAMEYTKGKQFSVKALKICIDYFVRRGHIVKAFVPRFRCKFGMSTEPRLLDDLERQGLVIYTPSRDIKGRRVCSYDDRYIVQCAAEFDGVIISGDNYRDLACENPRWQYVIENRVLPFTWVNDMIMFPRDPLGRNGPTLEAFLRHPTPTGPILL